MSILPAKELTTKAPQQVLKNVVVPINGRSSLGSSLSSVRDLSSEYDTPATSAAVTPAESLANEELASGRFGKHKRSNMADALSDKLTNGKRKRSEMDDLIQTDALLAQALQEDEYEEEGRLKRSISKRSRKGRIQDSEDDDPLSSSMAELSNTPATSRIQNSKSNRRDAFHSRVASKGNSEEDINDLFAGGIAKPKKVKTAQRTALPSRAVCDGAKKSMIGRNSHQILDSEDSDLSESISNVSLFASDLDSDAFEESGDSDTDVDDAFERSNGPPRSGSAAATASSDAIMAPTSVPRRRRARATPAANPNRVRRRYRGMEDRVCYTLLRTDYVIETDPF